MTQRTTKSATIASGASLSGAVDLFDRIMAGIEMPASWTAAGLSFEVSSDGVTYRPLTDDAGAEKTLVVAASKAVQFTLAEGFAWRYLKLRSGTSSAAVNQGADRVVTLVLVG